MHHKLKNFPEKKHCLDNVPLQICLLFKGEFEQIIYMIVLPFKISVQIIWWNGNQKKLSETVICTIDLLSNWPLKLKKNKVSPLRIKILSRALFSNLFFWFMLLESFYKCLFDNSRQILHYKGVWKDGGENLILFLQFLYFNE